MRKNLQDMYTEMYTEKEETEEVIEETLDRFAINDYTKIVYESKGHGSYKIVKKLMQDAMDRNLVKVKKTTNGYFVRSLLDDTHVALHTSENDFHYLRRFLQKLDPTWKIT